MGEALRLDTFSWDLLEKVDRWFAFAGLIRDLFEGRAEAKGVLIIWLINGNKFKDGVLYVCTVSSLHAKGMLVVSVTFPHYRL